MTRTTISLPEDLLHRLRLVAANRRTSMATVIREAVERELDAERPQPRSLGVAESGLRDTSEQASDLRPKPR